MDSHYLSEIFDHHHLIEYDKIESPIEETFLNHLSKFLSEDTTLNVQYPLNTINGTFRADICLKNDGKLTLIECDGEEHHSQEEDAWYDEWRDALILIQEKAEVIYRIKGTDIQNNLYKVFSILYSLDEHLFNSEYADRLDKVDFDNTWYKKRHEYDFHTEGGRKIPSLLEIKRKQLNVDFDRFWLKYIMYSLLNKGKNIKYLIKEMSSAHYESHDLIKMVNAKYPKLNLTDEEQLLTGYSRQT